MSERSKRLKSLVALQEKIVALHEMRHVTHLARANAAAREADELAGRAGEGSVVADLFGDLYARHIQAAQAREAKSRMDATREARRVAEETVRGSIVERAWREARDADERQQGDIERLEIIGRPKPDDFRSD